MSSLSQSHEIPAPVADDVSALGHHPQGAHAVPKRVLLGIFGLLCVLTVITVGVSYVDLGPANIWVALFVAVIKGGLVVMYFMHLRWDSPFNGVILIAAMFFVALFIGIAMLDSKEYQPNLQPPELIQQYPPSVPDKLPGDVPTPKPEQVGAAMLSPDEVAQLIKVDSSANDKRVKDMQYKAVIAAASKDTGDPKLGMALFINKGCVACHTTSKEQPPRAPYLGDVTVRHPEKEYVFESILLPSAKIAKGYETHYFKMKDQNILQGFLFAENHNTYTMRDTNGLTTVIPRSMVVKTGIIKKSLMAEGLADGLSIHDLASIYAFLDSLNNSTVASK